MKHGFYFPRVEVACMCPPIPYRGWDYQAYDVRTGPDLDCLTGLGETKREAALDLLDAMYYENRVINLVSYRLSRAWVRSPFWRGEPAASRRWRKQEQFRQLNLMLERFDYSNPNLFWVASMLLGCALAGLVYLLFGTGGQP